MNMERENSEGTPNLYNLLEEQITCGLNVIFGPLTWHQSMAVMRNLHSQKVEWPFLLEILYGLKVQASW